MANLSLMADAAHEHGALAGSSCAYGRARRAARESRWPRSRRRSSRATTSRSCVPKAMEHWDIRARAGRLGARRAAVARAPASTSSTSTAATATCCSSSCRRSTTSARDEYGGSLENRARFWLETARVGPRGGRRRMRDRLRIGVEALGPRESSSTRRSRSSGSPTTSSTSGTSTSARSRTGRRTRARPGSSRRAPARVDGPCARGDRTSRSSASGDSRTPTAWPRSSRAASGT